MIVLNFKSDTSQYADLAKFIDAFFKGYPELRKSPYHPKWTEVNLSSDVGKWTRFPPAAEAANKFASLTANACTEPVLRAAFLKFYQQEIGRSQGRVSVAPQAREKLFKQFQEWLQKNPN
jgi:hypothetical protein